MAYGDGACLHALVLPDPSRHLVGFWLGWKRREYLGYHPSELIPLAFALWPLIALGDLRLWKSPNVYGRIAEGPSLRASLLGNFDLFYLFALRYPIGWAIP